MTAKPGNARFALAASADFNGSIDAVSVSQVLSLAAFRSADGAWWEIAEPVVNVLAFGARPDNATNAGPSFQEALDYIAAVGYNRELYIPPVGTYLFTSGVTIGDGSAQRLALTIRGGGSGTRLVHSADKALFTILGDCTEFIARDFEVWAGVDQNDPTKGVFYIPNGLSRSSFYDIQGQQNGPNTRLSSFFYSEAGVPMDEITFHNIVEVHNHTGFRLGAGSSVWFVGGRSVGNYPATVCTGLDIVGGMGGVFVWGTDFIINHYNARVRNLTGSTNREIFFSQSCFDGGFIGLYIEDESYVNIVGCWAASADQACIECSFSGNGGVLNISGGTVYNAGVVSLNAGDKIGVIFGGLGRIDMSGVTVRENRNRGIYLTNPARTQFSNIRANNFFGNGTTGTNPCDIFVSGAAVVENNTVTNGIIRGSGDTIIRNNVGDAATITTPTIPASGTPITNQTGRTVEVFISGGTVSQVTKRGVPVFSSSNVSLLLQPGDAIAVTYTAAPTWAWVLP
ncbi:putative carbohydrate binding protein [Brucella phage V_19]|uniref:Putative carbohydrate binding protein n=23 Tax=Perisivirus Tb TaxID=1984800 RepID=H2EI66_9CAUD|nr:putative carbohydrate binding protein [Brucella phage Tb]AHB81145.1 putative carbohydrate binding protein [Brucella phage Fz]AKO59017.1 putative carbohydrate binding protein [Brucella phage 02_19]AKO59076.1 putative carbohydrate binding protein [Brucella phage 02_141]AKO59133.1 putative carbohydrate binding protein [Brucella phage 11sa_19]AKO59190.1 putative carbohydrate binding protein [Brucella phage 11sa_141]AKO59249.1 putative carbohydrate binding protein [Brucella phage 110_19]AKO593